VAKCAYKTELESELSEITTKIIEANLSNCGLFNVKRGTKAEMTPYKPWGDTLATVS
jgi:TolB protein